MKLHKILYASVISLAAGIGITSCDVNFDYPPVVSPDLGGNGNWDAPLSVAGAYAYYTAYYSDAPDTDKYYWVTGYIVGCVNTTETVFVCNDQTAAFSAPFESQTNLLLAQSPDCTDYTECISVQLPSGAVRNELNLNANGSNLGKEVSIRGYIDKYLSMPGVRSVTHYQWGPTGIDTGDVEVGKSEFSLLTEAIKSGRAYALVAEGSAAQTVSAGDNGFLYTEAVSISNNKFTASEKYGFMLTAIEEGSDKYYITDYKGQFLYQSTYGTGWSNRPSISTQPVKDNQGYYWTVVKNETGWVITNVVSKRILAYESSYKSYGLYNHEDFIAKCLAPELYEMANDPAIEPDFTPAEPSNPGDISEGTGEGTKESPYDVVRALAIIEAGSMTSDNVYIKGKISEISEIDISYGNATYYISNDGTTSEQLQVYRGYYLNGAKFTSTDALKVGDEVVILGKLIKYNTTPEVAQGSSIISLNGEGGGNTGGDTPSTDGNTIYEGLISHCDDWTFENVNLPDAATYIWSWKEYNGSYYLNASAYVGGAAYASEAYAYTTVDLTGKSSASLTFDHAAKFQTSLKGLCAVVVRVQGTTAWTALNMPTWPEAGTWTFVNCGSISLNAYAGKKIEIGFRYGSRDGEADTWEIKNFIVTGN